MKLRASREKADASAYSYTWPELVPLHDDDFRFTEGSSVDLKVRQDGEALRAWIVVYEPESKREVEVEMETVST